MMKKYKMAFILYLCRHYYFNNFQHYGFNTRYICCPNRTDTDACGTCPSCVKWNKLVHPDVHFVFPIVKKGKKEVCDDYIADWRHLVLNSPYFSLNHWLNEMDAENGQAIIYAKESDEIVRKLSLKSSEGGYKVTIVWLLL